MKILASVFEQPWFIILMVLAFFGLLILIIIVVKRHVKPLQIKKDDIDEEEAIKQELDRILVPIDDDKLVEKVVKDDSEEVNTNSKSTDEKKD